MGLHVDLHRARPHEGLAAHLSLIRLLVLMPPLVVDEVTLGGKPLVAAFHRAEIRLLPSVRADVRLQIAFLREALSAAFVRTDERSLASVAPLVHDEPGLLTVAVVTAGVLAVKSPLLGVRAHVIAQLALA